MFIFKTARSRAAGISQRLGFRVYIQDGKVAGSWHFTAFPGCIVSAQGIHVIIIIIIIIIIGDQAGNQLKSTENLNSMIAWSILMSKRRDSETPKKRRGHGDGVSSNLT
jgi:hypothetical protein